MSEPVFTKRQGKDKYQVRFWTRNVDYEAFVKAAEKEGLVMQDIFNDFMTWFCLASNRGELSTQVEEWKP